MSRPFGSRIIKGNSKSASAKSLREEKRGSHGGTEARRKEKGEKRKEMGDEKREEVFILGF
jgi:hypothetical protein